LLSGDDYQKLAGGPSAQETAESEAELINREILQAQLEEVMAMPGIMPPMTEPVESIGSLLSRRAEDLFRSLPVDQPPVNPHRNFSAPDVSSEMDEEIKPNFRRYIKTKNRP
jgi:hypothetical protein